jgi:hypothetical protein
MLSEVPFFISSSHKAFTNKEPLVVSWLEFKPGKIAIKTKPLIWYNDLPWDCNMKCGN